MKRHITISLLAVLLVSICSSAHAATPSSVSSLEILSFTTDKDIYSAKEEMTLNLTIHAPQDLSEVLITVEGVLSKKGVNYVTYSSGMSLSAGENIITFATTLPSCSACAGISQGTYYIEATVAHGGDVVKATHSIAITSGPNQVIPVNVTVEETRRIGDSTLNGMILVDVRSKTDYDAAHIKGAVSLPLANFSNSSAVLNKSDKIVVYSESGAGSSIATGILIEQGFERVYNVVGGFNAWNDHGYPTVSTTEENPPEASGSMVSIPGETTPAAPGFELALALVVLAVASRVRRRA